MNWLENDPMALSPDDLKLSELLENCGPPTRYKAPPDWPGPRYRMEPFWLSEWKRRQANPDFLTRVGRAVRSFFRLSVETAGNVALSSEAPSYTWPWPGSWAADPDQTGVQDSRSHAATAASPLTDELLCRVLNWRESDPIPLSPDDLKLPEGPGPSTQFIAPPDWPGPRYRLEPLWLSECKRRQAEPDFLTKVRNAVRSFFRRTA
jgi:hypothetical protein